MKTTFLSLNQAAKEAGKSTSTISKYLKNGRLSYVSKDDAGYKIDPAELFRVFPKKNGENIREQQNRKITNTPENTIKFIQLQADVEVLNEKLKMRDEKIVHLTDRLDDVSEERNEWRNQAKRVLEDLREKNDETEKDDNSEIKDVESNKKNNESRAGKNLFIAFRSEIFGVIKSIIIVLVVLAAYIQFYN